MTDAWTAQDMSDLTGRVAVVTGANSGIGLQAARQLAGHGADVTLAVRDEARGAAAAAQIQRWEPGSQVAVARLDLAELASVHAFADAWSAAHPGGLDLLVNNAGIMATPHRTTPDGFEAQLATNHLGHFALTALVLPALIARPRSRVVTISSQAHRLGRIHFEDLMSTRRYSAWGAYAQSKLANLLFASELQRRLDLTGIATLSMAAHPGYAATNLQSGGPRMRSRGWMERITDLGNRVLAQSAEMGALPTLFAATSPGLPGGAYVGPSGPFEQHGYPVMVGRSKAALNEATARRLWTVSEELTGVRFPLDA